MITNVIFPGNTTNVIVKDCIPCDIGHSKDITSDSRWWYFAIYGEKEARILMEAGTLMTKLLELERRTESRETRCLVLAMQDDVMELERNLITALGDNAKLAERLAGEKAKIQRLRLNRPVVIRTSADARSFVARLKGQLKKPEAQGDSPARFSTTEQIDDFFNPQGAY